MYTTSRIDLGNPLFKNLCSFGRTACGGDPGDEDLSSIFFKNLLYPSPMRDFEGGNGRAYSDGVEAKKAVTKNYGVARRLVCIM